MALIVSAASGNFNAGATWVGGVVPGVGDEAQAATGHTITITADVTCDEVSNAGTGIFTLNNGVTLTANVSNKSATANVNCLQFTAASPAVGNIVGNCTANLTTTGRGAVNTSSGTLNITGNCVGGASSGSASNASVQNSSTGTLNITGNCTGGSGTNARGADNISTGTLNITGNCIGGSGSPGAQNATGTLNITGNCIGGSGSLALGANNNSTGTMLVVGTIEASEFIGGVGGANRGQITLLTGPFLTSPTFGVNPIGCNAWRWASTLNASTYIEVPTSDLLAKRNLVTADNVTGLPAEADVKDGVVYGPASELTGTFEQTVAPSVSDIADAVWSATTRTLTEGGGISAEDVWTYATREITGGTVDTLVNAPTVPTAEDIATEVWDTPTSGLTTSGAIGTRLKNSSTVATTGSQLAAALS